MRIRVEYPQLNSQASFDEGLTYESPGAGDLALLEPAALRIDEGAAADPLEPPGGVFEQGVIGGSAPGVKVDYALAALLELEPR